MPRYYFNFRDGRELLDSEGVELADLDEARTVAVVASGEALKDHAGRFCSGEEWRMWVTDQSGATVCTLRFSAE